MSVMLEETTSAAGTSEQLSGYKSIWCRLESGYFWLYRSRPAHTADRLVNEYNKVVAPGRRYHAFPIGFDANVLGTNPFSLVVVQSIEDHLRSAGDYVFLRVKEQVAYLATECHGMKQSQIEMIEQAYTTAFNSKGDAFIGTGD